MITHGLRQRIRWEGRPHRDRSGFAGAEPSLGRSSELFSAYRLARWSGRWDSGTLDEVLGTLDLLDRVPGDLVPPITHLLDVGAKNWRYVGALRAWAEARKPPGARLAIHGVEIDGYRLYADLTTRASNARYYAAAASGDGVRCRYSARDAAEWRRPVSAVTWLFPFVARSTHRAWGLPSRLYSPESLFPHVFGVVREGGILVMANQGEWEWREAEALIRARVPAGFELTSLEVVEGSLHASPYPIFLTVWSRRNVGPDSPAAR